MELVRVVLVVVAVVVVVVVVAADAQPRSRVHLEESQDDQPEMTSYQWF